MASISKAKQDYAVAQVFVGRSMTDIASDMGVSLSALSRYTKTSEFKQRLAKMRQEADMSVARLGASAAAQAVGVLIKGLGAGEYEEGEDRPDMEHTRKCANDLLDRFGFARGQKVSMEAIVHHTAMTDEEVQEEIAALMLAGQGDQ